MTNSFRWKASAPKHRAATRNRAPGGGGGRERLGHRAAARKWCKNTRKDALEHNTVFKLYTEKKRIEKQYDEWNYTLRELGYK